MKNNNKGYTLVELLVSLAIFSIIIVGIILFMRNASVAYKNENIEVNVQKEAQIFLSQVEDLVIDSTASISTTTDGAGNPKYVITNPDGVSSITFIPGADGLGKVYYNDSYLMAEKVENFVIDKTTANDNSCTIKAVLAYNDASSNKRSYTANKEVYFRNTAIENNADHVLDLSVSATGTGPVTTANSRVIDRFEIVNVKDEFGIVTVTGIDNNYYKCLKTDSPTYYNATTDAVVKPDYASGNTFLVTTSTGVNDNPATNVASSTLTGVDASGSTVTVTLSTPAVSMSHGTGVIEYPIGSVNTSTGSGYFVSYIPLAGFDVNDYNKYWKPSSSSYSAIKYDLQILNNGSNVKSVTGKTVTQYLDAWHTTQAQFLQQQGRTVHKHGSYHHQQENGENQHNLLCGITQVFSNNLRKVSATVTNTQHTAQIVVRSTCKDTSEDNPEIGSRSELGTHDGTKDRSSTCNVQELYHENLP